ncbi:MAG: imidazolonepropionase [Spirochaetales bacterium]|nr:imidazolonepropionase [Spirochaetales bacterium]
MKTLVGPFSQLLTMEGLPLKGALSDSLMKVITGGALLLDGEMIAGAGSFEELRQKYPDAELREIEGDSVCMPGMIDVHTHICWGGSRAGDYASRIAGKTYLEIAGEGGGINVSVRGTREASPGELLEGLRQRALRHLREGVTTCEVKSGYGLDRESELKILRVINQADQELPIDLIPTALCAHIRPFDFEGTERQYLDHVLEEILPAIKDEKLAGRADIFIDQGAFTKEDGAYFLGKASDLGFRLTVHADQFTPGTSGLAVRAGALSADHLENISEEDIDFLAASSTVAVALPGCSVGLGMKYAPARKLLDRGASVAISTDWNPGSAPMGDLLMQAALISAAEKLSSAETFAAVTFRAAAALDLKDRGFLKKNMLADFILFPTGDFREILYNQGKLKPSRLWKKGMEV